MVRKNSQKSKNGPPNLSQMTTPYNDQQQQQQENL